MIVPPELARGRVPGPGTAVAGGLDRPWARRRLLERLGDRLRWVETRSAVDGETARALDAAGVTIHVTPARAGEARPETNTATVH